MDGVEKEWNMDVAKTRPEKEWNIDVVETCPEEEWNTDTTKKEWNTDCYSNKRSNRNKKRQIMSFLKEKETTSWIEKDATDNKRMQLEMKKNAADSHSLDEEYHIHHHLLLLPSLKKLANPMNF